jgi:hypothetical protein
MPSNWNGSLGPVTAHAPQGRAFCFDSLELAADWLARTRTPFHDRPPAPLDLLGPVYGAVILRDACGLIIPVWLVEAALSQVARPAPRFALWARGPNAYDHDRDFRKAPVPGVRKGRWGRMYRRVRTQGELRDLAGLEADLTDLEEFPVRVKIRRRRRGLPTAWDDLMVCGKGRGWKHHRRTRWKQA